MTLFQINHNDRFLLKFPTGIHSSRQLPITPWHCSQICKTRFLMAFNRSTLGRFETREFLKLKQLIMRGARKALINLIEVHYAHLTTPFDLSWISFLTTIGFFRSASVRSRFRLFTGSATPTRRGKLIGAWFSFNSSKLKTQLLTFVAHKVLIIVLHLHRTLKGI